MDNKFYHSVYLKPDRCKGCIHCLKRCPTGAIRVPNGKAQIIKEFCIDCSECILHCPYHAKSSNHDHLDVLDQYKYKVALVDPSIYGQFNNLHDINIILTAFLEIGFDSVFEVAYAHEYIVQKTSEYIEDNPDIHPIINTSCPTVMRLIRVRFPNLIENLLPLQAPPVIAARAAMKEALEKTGYSTEEIGIIYIAPCPAQVSYAKSPLGISQSMIDAVLAMKDIYKPLLHAMSKTKDHPLPLSKCGVVGISIGTTCSEAKSVCDSGYLAADGIENVINVLNDIEDEKMPSDLRFAELKGCRAGCVGGVLNIENPYIARAKIKQLIKTAPETEDHSLYFEGECGINPHWTQDFDYEPVYRLGNNMIESMQKMEEVEEILKSLPKLDCGSCGAPTCRTLAEDIVRGTNGATRGKCIYMLRGFYNKMMKQVREEEEVHEKKINQGGSNYDN